MTDVVIQYQPDPTSPTCAFCGETAVAPSGPRLQRADDGAGVCRDCGRKHAPWLAALLDLALVAERVGRIGRYTVAPPMSALLDLARAAENYTHKVCRE